MNGLQAIRNINAANNEKHERFQAQYKGDSWYVFDSYTGGWGDTPYATAREAQAAADAL